MLLQEFEPALLQSELLDIMAKVFHQSRELPPSHVYNPGHFSYRTLEAWCNPCLAAKDGTTFQVVVKYVKWLVSSGRWISEARFWCAIVLMTDFVMEMR